ncbi:CLUMA_CG005320, isoform A [Clunio marinus]|uniref:CLUMA_CG005320, isoform A n=1 Tax=Clunio marinus TaxID=568069 RepID=A0A1J1HUC3_9DIPT|nr:CLUMA_CG005320, isoform A [Clunio marinus]
MSLFCRLCFDRTTEYFTIDVNFRGKILKYLNLQLSDNALICKTCTEKIDAFDQFYELIHKSQENFYKQQTLAQVEAQQNNEIRYIIVLKDNKSQLKLNEASSGDSNSIESGKEKIAQETVNPIFSQNFHCKVVELAEEKLQETNQSQSDEEIEKASVERELNCNLDKFPKEMIKNGRLVVKGKALVQLVTKFYRLECSLCEPSIKFRKYTTMMSHFKSVHSEKGFVTCCDTKISKLKQVALHMARHVQPNAFRCHLCNKLLTCPKILQYHIQNHLPEGERNLKCPEPNCNRAFSYQSALSSHVISHLPEEKKTLFCCETCGKRFGASTRLTAHINSVHKKLRRKTIFRKEHKCDTCLKNFASKSNLSYHLTTHKDFEFQTQCTICQKWLKNKHCLRKHMSIHSETRFFCDKCDYSAVNRQCFISHKRVKHSDLKPFICEICEKAFKLKNTLTNHVNAQHSGLRKYSCEFCFKTFVSSGNYYSHRKRMHPQELSRKLREKEIKENQKRLEIQHKKVLRKS